MTYDEPSQVDGAGPPQLNDMSKACSVSRSMSASYRPVAPRRIASLFASALPLLITSCVERTVTITTEPEGATVFLNDQEVGQSPVRVPFTWYGDYDIIARKKGYQTLKTNHRLDTPWYQYPLIDVIAECFMPFTVYDDREIGPLFLDEYHPPENEAILERAADMRTRALSESAE